MGKTVDITSLIMKKVLVIGGGGREHAIVDALSRSPQVGKIYCAPGNAGIGQIAECVPIGAMEFDKLVAFAKEKEIDLTVIGMDDPLVGGVVDAFEEAIEEKRRLSEIASEPKYTKLED